MTISVPCTLKNDVVAGQADCRLEKLRMATVCTFLAFVTEEADEHRAFLHKDGLLGNPYFGGVISFGAADFPAGAAQSCAGRC